MTRPLASPNGPGAHAASRVPLPEVPQGATPRQLAGLLEQYAARTRHPALRAAMLHAGLDLVRTYGLRPLGDDVPARVLEALDVVERFAKAGCPESGDTDRQRLLADLQLRTDAAWAASPESRLAESFSLAYALVAGTVTGDDTLNPRWRGSLSSVVTRLADDAPGPIADRLRALWRA